MTMARCSPHRVGDAPGFQLVEIQSHGVGIPRDADVKSEIGTRRDGVLKCERAAASSVQGDRDCAIHVLCCLYRDVIVPGGRKATRVRVGELRRSRGLYPERHSTLVETPFHPMGHSSSSFTGRRADRDTRPIRPAIVTPVARTDGSRGRRRTEARVSKSEHDAVEINPPDYCLDRLGMPVRREEIQAPSHALGEALRQTDLRPAAAQVDQWETEQPAVARFKHDGPSAHLARVAPQLRCRPSRCLPAGDHAGLEWSRDRASRRASHKSANRHELGDRAILALSTGFPTMGVAMLDQAPHVTPRGTAAAAQPSLHSVAELGV